MKGNLKEKNQNIVTSKQAKSTGQLQGFDVTITQFSTIMVELLCVEINRQLTLQLDYDNCMEDVTNFLVQQKIITKNTEVSYSLPNNPIPVNSLWTLKQIIETFDIKLNDKITFTVQVSEEDHDYGKFQIRKEACCKCEIF